MLIFGRPDPQNHCYLRVTTVCHGILRYITVYYVETALSNCAMTGTEDNGEDFEAFCMYGTTFDRYQHAKSCSEQHIRGYMTRSQVKLAYCVTFDVIFTDFRETSIEAVTFRIGAYSTQE